LGEWRSIEEYASGQLNILRDLREGLWQNKLATCTIP